MTSTSTTNDIPTVDGLVDPRPAFARAVDVATTAIAAVRPGQHHLPTPCEEFDVIALVGHLITVARRVDHIGRGDGPFISPPFVTEVPGDDWSAAWAAAATGATEAWSDDATLTAVAQLPWTQLPGAQALALYVSEVIVHTWDLATATGQQLAWDDEALDLALTIMQQELPAEGRTEAFDEVLKNVPPGVEVAYPFALAVAVPADAPLIDRLVAHNGRQP